MFAIFQQNGTVHWTPHTIKQGKKKRVPASSFTLEFDAPNDILNRIEPGLKESLYRKPLPNEGDAADQADPRLQESDYLPKLRHPGITNDLELRGELIGAAVTFHQATGKRSDVELDDCKVDNYRVTPKENGIVRCKVRVNCVPSTNGKMLEFFYDHQDQEVNFTITPARADNPAQGKLVDFNGEAGEQAPQTAQQQEDPFAGSDLAADPDQRPAGWPFPQQAGEHQEGDEPPVGEDDDESENESETEDAED